MQNSETNLPRNNIEFAALSDKAAKAFYTEFCATESSISNYLQPWWLDAVCPKGDWKVCISFDNEGKVNGILTYQKVKLKGIFTAIVMPKFTPNAGIWMRIPDEKKSKLYSKYAAKKQIMDSLIAQLPQVSFFHLKFHYSVTDWQPFFWKGYIGSPHYTYIIDNISDLKATFANFKGSVRTDIRKAEKILTIEESDDIELYYDFYYKSFKNQGLKPQFDLLTLSRLDKILKEKDKRTLLLARDKEGRVHAANYIVFDVNTANYVAGGSDIHLRNSGALPLLIWSAVQKAAERGIYSFDFEGSMLPTVEYAFRNYGARQVSFLRITKTSNLFYEVLTYFFPNYR
jgi:hypothetical protein